jgi:AcrR family transcriptional regulator
MSATGRFTQAAVPKRADARRNYDRLLAAAAAAFAEHGADDVSLEEIARRAEVGIGTLYRHFPSRQSLLEAVYADQVEGLELLAGKLLAAESPTGGLAEWLRAMVTFGRTKRSLSAALVEMIGRDSELLSSCAATLRASAGALLERAQQAGEVRADVQGADLLRLTHGLILAADWSAGDTSQTDRMLALVMDGLTAVPGRRDD